MCSVREGHGFGLQYSMKFGWTPKLSCFKISWTHSFQKNAARSVKYALYQLSLLLWSRVFHEATYKSSLENWYFVLKVNEAFIWILKSESNSHKCKGFVVQHLRACHTRMWSCTATRVDNGKCLCSQMLQSIFCRFWIVVGNRTAPLLPS